MEKKLSCIDCAVTKCNHINKDFPDFCVTTHLDKDFVDEAMKKYEIEENRKIMIAAAEAEYEGYEQLTRVQEIIEFAKKIGAKKLGIATCVGLINESRILARILRDHGFEVYGAACKVGVRKKSEVGIPAECNALGENMCNPILQAEILNKEKTDLNLVMGLCVGHDSLFYKHSDAFVTTVVTKDRVLGHNPVAALYTANTYYKKKLAKKDEK